MEKQSPADVGKIVHAIDNGEVKVKGSKKSKGESQSKKTKGVKGNNGNITHKTICAWLEKQNKHVTSTEIRDALGFKSRTQARRVLKRLAKLKKVAIEKRKLSDKRQIFTYGIA